MIARVPQEAKLAERTEADANADGNTRVSSFADSAKAASRPFPKLGSTVRLIFDLPDELSLIPFLRKSSRQMMEGLGVFLQDIEDLELIVAELATNAICHANGGSYQIKMEFLGYQATVTVTDRGAGFSLNDLPEPGTPRPNCFSSTITQQRVGGFGLPLVIGLVDQLDASPNEILPGMMVRAQKTLQSHG